MRLSHILSPRLCAFLTILTAALFSTTFVFALKGFDPSGSGPGYPDSANGRNSGQPSLSAYRTSNGGIKIDGRLDETDWNQAPAGTGFTQYEPERGGDPGEETVIKVVYDDDAIYFGIACLRTNGSSITSCLSRRDQITSSDLIRVYISPYHDQTTGYHFRINPHGVKEDYYNYGDLYHDQSWDAVWEADTSRDEDGWYAEIRIPFSSIRYRESESMTWGFNVFQYIHSLGQRTAWSNWDRDQSGFMSRSGTITDINGIRPPRQLEVTPYMVARVTDPADPSASSFDGEDWDQFGNIGADIKYGITPDLTLSATVQPDFGQVEADPSLLNLSPFETYFQEKRPFFVEGAQFFWHPDNTVFYSRRIGTGSRNSRIRAAGKLTGKIAGDVSTAVLFAATDETGDGQAHNFLKSGNRRAYYGIGRFGTQVCDDQHSFNIMGTAVVRDRESFDYTTRNGYTGGGDFELNFKDRMYQATGSFVGSFVDYYASPEPGSLDPKPTYGTGTRFEFEKRSGDWRWALTTRHQSDKLDINDLGYINNPDHYAAQAWATRVFNSGGENDWFTQGNLHFRTYKSWIYSSTSVADPDDPGQDLWTYGRGHTLLNNYVMDGFVELRNRWGSFWGLNYNPGCTDLYGTRWTPDYSHRGPLMSSPDNYQGHLGFFTDSRKDLIFELFMRHSGDEAGSWGNEIQFECEWVLNSNINLDLEIGHTWARDDAQWMGNFDNPAGGIGNVSYTFGELKQRTWDVTLRSSFLFDRDKSLELYLQPFLAVGDYSNLRELVLPDSYDLQPWDGYDPRNEDFSIGAVNMNFVYRWEYRPGSTIFLVWTHARRSDDLRQFHGTPDDPDNTFTNNFGINPLFNNEAENTFLIKVSYWFPI
ncbi:MAG: carbohydrate binding family 9 domain-containing protein [Gemmatimonadales bacterium]|nr:carbohydrate binding family 9 domain-containing protein [Gemmatimonadales bacterium]